MNLNPNEKENKIYSLKDYDIIQTYFNTYLNYIQNYYSTSKDFQKKLLSLQKGYEEQKKELEHKINKKLKQNLSQIIYCTDIIPNIFDVYTQNLGTLLETTDKQIELYDKFFKDQLLSVKKFNSEHEEAKNELLKREAQIDKCKNSFLESIANSENIIYKYYSSKKNTNNTKDKIFHLLNINRLNQNIITEEQVMTSIKNTQKLEKIYKGENEKCKLNQESYFQSEKNLSENVKKVIKVISEKLISSINSILLLIKNNFLTQEKRIENYLNEVKGKSKIENNINDFFKQNNQEKKSYNLIKYNLQVLKEGKDNNDSKKKFSGKNLLNLFGNKIESDISKKDKIIYINDDLEEMPFIDDEISLLTAKKMISSFTLVSDGCFKLDIEEEKTTTKKISMKIFVDFKKPKLNDNENENIINEIKDDEEKEEKMNSQDFVIINENIISITEKEIELFERLLDKHHNRVIFLQQLNNFRSTGKHLIPIKLSEIVIHFFNIILDTVKRDNDIHSAKNIILMSQIYYTDDKSKKHYLQEYIIDHKLFKDSKFWEDFIESEINKEIKKLKESQIKLGINNQNDKINEIKNKPKLFDSIYFGQIVTISENMIKFGLSKDRIYQIIEPKIKVYELSQEMIDNIKTIISTRFNEINKKND